MAARFSQRAREGIWLRYRICIRRVVFQAALEALVDQCNPPRNQLLPSLV